MIPPITGERKPLDVGGSERPGHKKCKKIVLMVLQVERSILCCNAGNTERPVESCEVEQVSTIGATVRVKELIGYGLCALL
jgi:hypothetical protein